MIVVIASERATAASRIVKNPLNWARRAAIAADQKASRIIERPCRPLRSEKKATLGDTPIRRKKGTATTIEISAAVSPRHSSHSGRKGRCTP